MVVIIIGVIFGISFVQLKTGEMKTRDARRKADVELVARALERYYLDYEKYPAATGSGQIVACGDKGQEACNWGSEDSLVDDNNVSYLKGLAKDPFDYKGQKYIYVVDETEKNFKIFGKQVGCGIDKDSYAMAYAKAGKKPAIGVGVTLDYGRLPFNVMMDL